MIKVIHIDNVTPPALLYSDTHTHSWPVEYKRLSVSLCVL